MVWSRKGRSDKHKARSRALEPRAKTGDEMARRVREGRGSRGGAPIWICHAKFWMPDPGFDLGAIREKFWARVRRGGIDECWEWLGGKTDKGYGRFCVRRGLYVRAHRVAWMLKHGPLPDELDVLHTCDNPGCVNNERHLFPGTNADNMADMYAKGRRDHQRIAGERNGGAKLTAEQVVAIRNRLLGGAGHRALAREYGVSHRTIGRIAHGSHWR